MSSRCCVIAHGVPALYKPYGAFIAAKIADFALLMGLAALKKWKMAPAVPEVDGPSSMALRRSLLTEYALIMAVLGATPIMTAFYSPVG